MAAFDPLRTLPRTAMLPLVRLIDELKAGAKLAVMLPFIAVISVPMMAWVLIARFFDGPTTPEDVAAVLRKCLEGASDADDEVDSFTSMKIADPQLNEIKTQLGDLCATDWESPETRRELQEMLRRVEAMPATPPH